jgi:two-component system, NarL family, sensor kinase
MEIKFYFTVMRKLILIIVCFFSLNCVAQTNVADSMQLLIDKMPDDTAKVNKLNDLARKIQYSDPLKASLLISSAVSLSEKIKYPLGRSAAYGIQAAIFVNQMKLDSSKIFADRAYQLVKGNVDVKSKNQIGIITNIYGVIYQQQQHYDSATIKYLEAAQIFTETGNNARMFYTYSNLSVIYTFLDDNLKMEKYAKAAYDVALKTNDTALILRGILSLVGSYDKLENYDSLFPYAKTGLIIANRQQETFSIGKFQQILGEYFLKKEKNYDTAIAYFNKSLGPLSSVNSQYDIPMSWHYLGNAYLMKKDYPKAISFLKKAIDAEKSLQLNQLLVYSLDDMVEAEEKSGNIAEAFRYQKEFVAINDSLQKNNNRKQVNDLEAKYQTQKKEAQLLVQQSKIERKNILNYILAGSAFALLLISFLSYRSYKHKQKLQQQRISELETQQQLTATEAVLKGEEQERTRLAKDLHDGLGGMLSGIKYSFNSMKGNIIMTPENNQAFERSMDMLDSSIKEMRRVAHNMMPEALVKFGLDTALKDFCNDINQSGALQVSYQSMGLQNAAIEQTSAITIYRIVQELINNTIKHAAAKTAIVQVTQAGKKLAVTVEDDGKGFDVSILDKSRGIGWDNIQNRVEFLKGKMDVQSVKEKGTSVHIEFDI